MERMKTGNDEVKAVWAGQLPRGEYESWNRPDQFRMGSPHHLGIQPRSPLADPALLGRKY